MRCFPYTNQQGDLIRRLWMRLLLLPLLGIAIAAALADHLFVGMGAYFRLVLSFSKIYGL
jgi:hypothetical protein